jgi:predicted transcriptional regulator
MTQMNVNEKVTINSEEESSPQGINEVIITLLGRIAYPPDQLTSIISKKKQDPEAYIRGYNLCDGKHTLTQIAEEMKVSPGTLSPIINNWKDIGIVYEVKKGGQKFFKRLYKLNAPKLSKKTTTDNEEENEQVPKEVSDTQSQQSQG